MVCLLAAAALAALLPGVAMAQGNHQGGTYYPEQIHLSLTGIPGEMVIDWISSVPAGTATVLYSEQPWLGVPLMDGCAALKETGPPQCEPPNVPQPKGKPPVPNCCCGCNPNSAHAEGWSGCAWSNATDSCGSFIRNVTAEDVGTSKEMGETEANYTLHSAVLKNLTCGAEYFYRLGSPAVDRWYETAELISFRMLCDKGYNGREPIWAAYGDLGLAVDEYRPVAPSIPLLTAELQNGEKGPAYDAVLHAGDYAYDFSNDGGRIGDAFMNAIQPFASKVPCESLAPPAPFLPTAAFRLWPSFWRSDPHVYAVLCGGRHGSRWQPRVWWREPAALRAALRRSAAGGE